VLRETSRDWVIEARQGLGIEHANWFKRTSHNGDMLKVEVHSPSLGLVVTDTRLGENRGYASNN
jgi:hypothetical protein